MFKRIALLAVSALVLTGCAAAPKAVTTLSDGSAVPATTAAVIDLVNARYGDCFSQLGEAKYSYAPSSKDSMFPGTFQALGDGWAVGITVGEITDRGVLPTVPSSQMSTDLLASVGC